MTSASELSDEWTHNVMFEWLQTSRQISPKYDSFIHYKYFA